MPNRDEVTMNSEQSGSTSSGGQAGQGGGRSSTNGGPIVRTSALKMGQLDWIPSFTCATPAEFSIWKYQFKTGADFYLANEIFDTIEKRRVAWQNALIKSASLAKNFEMIKLLELHTEAGVFTSQSAMWSD
jgi:hypothetical protein